MIEDNIGMLGLFSDGALIEELAKRNYCTYKMQTKYEIPEGIKTLLNKDFVEEFISNVLKNFDGETIEDIKYRIDVDSETVWWYNVLRKTCENLNLMQILKYYDSLEWFDSGYFAGQLSEIILGNIDE